jgi:hypothetical protein
MKTAALGEEVQKNFPHKKTLFHTDAHFRGCANPGQGK